MNFNDVQIPEMLIAEIFKTSLVEDVVPADRHSTDHTPAKTAAPKTGSILIGVHYPGAADIPGEQYTFLNSVLNACQLNIRDAVIINTATQSARLADLSLKNPKCILLFNINASSLQHSPEPVPLEVTILNGIPVFSAPDLKEFTSNSAQSRSLKSKLWAGLKQIFNI